MSTEFGRRIRLARTHAGFTQKRLAQLAGISQSTLAELESTGHTSGRALQIAQACGVEPQWLVTGEGSMLTDVIAEEPAAPYRLPAPTTPRTWGIANRSRRNSATVSQSQVEAAPPIQTPVQLRWGDIVAGSLPGQFALTLFDDSMAMSDPPAMRQGDRAIFTPSDTAHAGQTVLIRDPQGHHYVRRYLARTPTHWLAVARNPGYAELDSARDGLQILAVQIGILWD